MAGPTISDELTELHNDYAWEINAAVERDDDEHVALLADEFTEVALRVLTSPRRAT